MEDGESLPDVKSLDEVEAVLLLLLLDRVSADAGFRRLETRARAFSTSVTATTKSLIEKIAIVVPVVYHQKVLNTPLCTPQTTPP